MATCEFMHRLRCELLDRTSHGSAFPTMTLPAVISSQVASMVLYPPMQIRQSHLPQVGLTRTPISGGANARLVSCNYAHSSAKSFQIESGPRRSVLTWIERADRISRRKRHHQKNHSHVQIEQLRRSSHSRRNPTHDPL